MAATTRLGTLMGPVRRVATGITALGVVTDVAKLVGVGVGSAVGLGTRVERTVASVPHAEIPARNTMRDNANINLDHRNMGGF